MNAYGFLTPGLEGFLRWVEWVVGRTRGRHIAATLVTVLWVEGERLSLITFQIPFCPPTDYRIPAFYASTYSHE